MGQPCINNATYKPYIQPILQYGNEAKIITIPATFNKRSDTKPGSKTHSGGGSHINSPTTTQVLTINKCSKNSEKNHLDTT